MRATSALKRFLGSVTLVAMFGLSLAPEKASADEISVTSRIEAVTVFPTGAEIMRTFTVDLAAGDYVLKIPLPNDVQPNSIQIRSGNGATVTVNSLDLRPAPVDDEARKERDDAIRAEIAALDADIGVNEKRIENAMLSRELVETLARRKLQPQGPETAPPVPEPQDLIALLDMVDARMLAISESILTAQAEIDASHERIAVLVEVLAEPREPKAGDKLASIYLTAGGAGSAAFELTYRLGSASWQPLYEARLSTGEGSQAARLELVRNASVTQGTTEDWDDVGLSISTAQRTARISPPVLKSQSVSQFAREVDAEAARFASERDRVSAVKVGNTSDGTGAEGSLQTDPASAGFNVMFKIPGRVDIDRSGTARTVRIGATTMPANLSLSAIPKIDLTAYLVARFTVQGEAPLLPGRVMLFRDGVFIGEAFLPLTTPGETLELGFGADDLVRIERREVARKSGETGLVSTAYIEERSYLMRVTSRHSFDIPIILEDQTPVTNDERVRVEFLPGTTRPDVEDVDNRSGVYSWTRVLKPNVPQEIGFGFRITWPKGISR
ncbi:mucoidy inhibitor MuiA family protein [Boseongicola aestuarii]|uniref:DUF4139 domain-containing protein n=1 Tax=Boseongicola aestuarii TaxID=1470561 RepID=A0A238J2N8_9RHOB|nr:mucoidy inhibitor MuiA family protein [Boseongicola aestuarii]SMX24492.1 hypothetical protein BOA8489_02618 [Boseongicola aestuarii]